MLDDLAAAWASAAVSDVVATLLSIAGLAQETRNRTARPRPLERWWRRMAALPFCGARDCPPVPETAPPGKSFENFLGRAAFVDEASALGGTGTLGAS